MIFAWWPIMLGLLGAGDAKAAPKDPGPVILELFTSQGCESCPPADAVLTRLGTDPSTRDLVVPLAFHVDYWNRIGWVDPFSAAKWSERQEAYTRVFGPDRMYTPQAVVNGHTEMNGAKAQQVAGAIVADLERPRTARVEIALRFGDGPAPALVAVKAEMLKDVAAAKLELLVALFENEVVTRVTSGENRGSTLRNDFVVRRLETALTLEPRGGAHAGRELAWKLDSRWKRDKLGVAAFLQDPKSLKIHGAARFGG